MSHRQRHFEHLSVVLCYLSVVSNVSAYEAKTLHGLRALECIAAKNKNVGKLYEWTIIRMVVDKTKRIPRSPLN